MLFQCYNGGTKAPKCYVCTYTACRIQNKICLHILLQLCDCFDTQRLAFNIFMHSDLFRDFPNSQIVRGSFIIQWSLPLLKAVCCVILTFVLQRRSKVTNDMSCTLLKLNCYHITGRICHHSSSLTTPSILILLCCLICIWRFPVI
jgi:hypothetical protein